MLKMWFALVSVAWLSAAPSKELCQRPGVCGHACTGAHTHRTPAPVPCCFRTFDVEVKAGERRIDCQFRGGLLDIPGRPREYCCSRNVHSHFVTAPLDTASSGSSSSSSSSSSAPLPQPPSVAIHGVYLQNRMMGTSTITHNTNFISHTFLFTVGEDGNLGHTYSWGNAANTRGWHKDAAEDIVVATLAIQGKTALDIISEPSLIPFLEEAYQIRCKPEFDHPNLVVDDSCKTEAQDLVKLARELQMKKR